jgi:hypothetical protein
MKYRVDIYALASGGIILAFFLFLFFFMTACTYPEQKPTKVMELHNEAINGVVMPNPSPIDIDFELRQISR